MSETNEIIKVENLTKIYKTMQKRDGIMRLF